MQTQIWRQGDVLIRQIPGKPKGKKKVQQDGCLAYGEVTGHAHRIEDLTKAELLVTADGKFLCVDEGGVRIVHEEHAPINLPSGNFEIIQQREYSHEEIRNVAD